MEQEMLSLAENTTWKYEQLPIGRNAIGCKWVYDYKYDEHGQIIRYKARLVAKGFLQKAGVDFNETFAPVLRYKSLRVILSIVSLYNLELVQMDVVTAFLNAHVKEELFMKQPQGYHIGNNNVVCRLLKAVYGTKQAPHDWNEVINNFLISIGFKRCSSDTCVYIKRTRTGRLIIIGLFVDDLPIGYHKQDEAEWFEIRDQFMARFKMKYLGECRLILGMRITRDRHKNILTIDNEVYINRMLTRFKMKDCHPKSTPASHEKLIPTPKYEEDKEDKQLYQSIVGALNYLQQASRPDIALATNQLCRYASNPGPQHMIAAKRVLRYLRGTTTVGLTYSGGDKRFDMSEQLPISIDTWTDADWGGDLIDRKSTTGYVIKIGNCSVSWATKKQPTVALSTAEAEYMAISAGMQESLSIQQLLYEILGTSIITSACNIHTDNQSAISISKDDVNHQRTKHIDIRHHFIRDHVRNGDMKITWVPTSQQTADILTKPLGRIQHTKLRHAIMNAQHTYSKDNKN